VGNEELGQFALQDHDPNALISLELPAELVEFLRQYFVEKIYGRVIDADEYDPGIKSEPEAFVVGILHGVTLNFGELDRRANAAD
jgi:hypothetical protein